MVMEPFDRWLPLYLRCPVRRTLPRDRCDGSVGVCARIACAIAGGFAAVARFVGWDSAEHLGSLDRRMNGRVCACGGCWPRKPGWLFIAKRRQSVQLKRSCVRDGARSRVAARWGEGGGLRFEPGATVQIVEVPSSPRRTGGTRARDGGGPRGRRSDSSRCESSTSARRRAR